MGLLSFFIILGIAIFSIKHWITNKSYLFDADEIANIAKKYSVIGHRTESKDIEVTFAKIAREFEKRYPGHILPKQDREWLFMNAGGWMGSFCLLHASLTEYVLFFGTAIDTSGHSGRYWANISDTMLVGSFTQWKEGKLHPNKFGPGDTINHAWGEVTAVHWTAGTWMVEYGRGFIPSTLGFALSDTVFSTQDFYLLFKIMKIYSKAIVQEIIATINHLKKSL